MGHPEIHGVGTQVKAKMKRTVIETGKIFILVSYADNGDIAPA